MMHELALSRRIVEMCAGRAGGARVARVTLELGRLAAVTGEALHFCFDVCAGGTVCEGAALEIVEVPGRGRCCACGAEFGMNDYLARCACGSIEVECIGGDGLKVRDMEVV